MAEAEALTQGQWCGVELNIKGYNLEIRKSDTQNNNFKEVGMEFIDYDKMNIGLLYKLLRIF